MTSYATQLFNLLLEPSVAEKYRVLKTIALPQADEQWPMPTLPHRPARPAHFKESAKPLRRHKGLEHEQTRHKFLLAIHHIELSAIDLALLQCLRGSGMPTAYHADFIRIACEECEHATLLDNLLTQRGYPPGSQAVHFALWDTAVRAENIGDQLVIIPRFLEARGLDVSADILPRMRSIDPEAGAALSHIYHDEIGHVGIGTHWHHVWCKQAQQNPVQHYLTTLEKYFGERLPRTAQIDHAGRKRAGFNTQEVALLVRR